MVMSHLGDVCFVCASNYSFIAHSQGGQCAAVVNNLIYYFGGRTKSKSMLFVKIFFFPLRTHPVELAKDEYLNDLYCFNTSTKFLFDRFHEKLV
jgi:hypothetical protein